MAAQGQAVRRCHVLALLLGVACGAWVSTASSEDAHLAALSDDELLTRGHGHLREGSVRGALYYLGAALARREADLELTRTVVMLHHELCHLDEVVALCEAALARPTRPEDIELRAEFDLLVADITASSRELTVLFARTEEDERDVFAPSADTVVFAAVDPATQPPGCTEEIDRRLRHHLGTALADSLPPALTLRVPLGDFIVGDRPLAVRAVDPQVAVRLTLPAADTGTSAWWWTAGGVALVGGAVVAVTLLARETPPPRLPDTITFEVAPR